MNYLLINRKATLLTIRLCAVGLAFFIQETTFAQTNTFPATGNVGIGTTSPGFKLDVVGRSRFQAGSGSAGFWLRNLSNTTDKAFIGMNDDDNYVGIYGNNGAGWNFLMNVTNGNIGIGTSPAQKLDVNGTIQATGFKLPTGAAVGKVLVSDANGVASWTTLSGSSGGWTLSGSNSTTTGNVGIGTTTPTQKLDVNGTIQATGFKLPTGAGVGKVLVSDANGVGSWGNQSVGTNGNIAIGANTLSNITTGTSNVAIGALALSNTTTGADNVVIGDGSGISVNGQNNILIGKNTDVPNNTGSGQLNIGNTLYATGMGLPGAGNVGIGTTSPTQKLEVAGTVKATQFNMALPSPVDQTAQYIAKADANGNMVWTKFRDIHDIYTATWGTNINANGYKLVTSGADTLGMRLDTQGGLWSDGGYSCFVKNVPDYVFAADYTLMPLAETEQFIKTQKHLPGIPSEAEYKKRGGVELYELSMKLLEKVEELTLHLIEQDKEKETLQTKMAAMQQEIDTLKKR